MENKGENRRTNKIPRIKKPPYFKAGLLAYEHSGHTLTKSGKYYRCTLNCRGECSLHNHQIPSETLERSFGRYFKPFAIEGPESKKILKKIMRESLIDILFGIDDMMDTEEEYFNATLEAIKRDVLSNEPIKTSDLNDAATALTKIHQANYPLLLLGFATGMLAVLANVEKEAELGRTFAFMSKKVSLSITGTIESIEFEKWAWYCLNQVDRFIPGYLDNIKKEGVKILNTRHEPFLEKGLAEAALSFDMERARDAMSVSMSFGYQLVKIMKDGIDLLTIDEDPKKAGVAAVAYLDTLKNNPAVAIMMQAANFVGLTMEIPKNHEPKTKT